MNVPRRSLVVAAVAVLWALALALDVVPQIRGDAGWRWPYEVPREMARLWPLGLALIVYGVGARWLWRRSAGCWVFVSLSPIRAPNLTIPAGSPMPIR